MPVSYAGARVFDGETFVEGALVVEGGHVVRIGAPEGEVVALSGLIAPGFIDLQVNGAGGVQVDGACDVDALRVVCEAQGRLGATGCLPTLITDTYEATARVVEAGIAAARAGVPGFLGLHLEGPHLDPRRRGAHDPGLIRPMEARDLDLLLAAAAGLPGLMVTLAPEAVTGAQIAALAAAGVVVSLGHTDCPAEEAREAMARGARCATHLFNAMSQMANRAPGLVGAVLGGDGFAGIIADGRHVDPLVLRVALAARGDGLFLVTDCMGLAGTDAVEVRLGGRLVRRQGGVLTLDDSTLAGADVTMAQSLRVLTEAAGVPLGRALAMACSVPARAIGRAGEMGYLRPGRRANFVHLTEGLDLAGVWRAGMALG